MVSPLFVTLFGRNTISQLKEPIICIPVFNVFGYLNQQREFPDGRDLNRMFPGSADGSLASQFAHAFTKENSTKSRLRFGLSYRGCRNVLTIPMHVALLTMPNCCIWQKFLVHPFHCKLDLHSKIYSRVVS